MNGTEAAYAQLLEARKRKGEIEDYGYERLTFKLGPDLRLTPDFDVWFPDGELQLHEVKANWGGKPHVEDDARAKLKVLSDLFPVRLFVCFPSDRTKTHFTLQEVGG